jgi:hypothetical protein
LEIVKKSNHPWAHHGAWYYILTCVQHNDRKQAIELLPDIKGEYEHLAKKLYADLM